MDQVIAKIYEEMTSDDENDSEKLVAYYRGASRQERAAMNELCMFLCGWSLETIFQRCGLTVDSDTGDVIV